ncbi:multidrug effflux MFS transporter [Alloalcanivorax xenomutans]|uniref:multidrug effflux MFS transporter n=1 Tax=Alloalcanivorax xenomutans TaxID=1094342 RepID=UPI0024E1B621|nr:multidrug effflux MFS transporter [Alloalcanivorax xenomutans]
MTDSRPTPGASAPLWGLALLTFSGTLAMHIFVPALALAGDDLNASASAMQMTVSLYILGLAVGQLVYGPLSDHFGRRPVLMVGLGLYTLAGLAAALAPEAKALIAARLFQALGGCAGLTLARAIVRDTTAPREAAQRLAMMNLMVTLGPGIAPILGGLLANELGWRWIFYLLVGLGVANVLFTWRLLPETRPRDSGGGNVKTLVRDYQALLRSPAFLGFALGGGCATTSVYAFISAAPFVFVDQLQVPAEHVGLYLALLVSGMSMGNVFASRLLARFPMRTVLMRANQVSVLAAFVFLGAVLSEHLSLTVLLLSLFVFATGLGIAAPATLTEAISVIPSVTGSASGLYGFTQMAIGALCSALAVLGDDPALAAAVVLASAGVIGQIAFHIALRSSE